MNTAVEVEAGDKIGFTNQGDYGPISFTYAERRRTYFSKVNVTNATGVLIPNYPLTGDVVKFDYTYLPSIFSIAVELDTSEFWRNNVSWFGSMTPSIKCVTLQGAGLTHLPTNIAKMQRAV